MGGKGEGRDGEDFWPDRFNKPFLRLDFQSAWGFFSLSVSILSRPLLREDRRTMVAFWCAAWREDLSSGF